MLEDLAALLEGIETRRDGAPLDRHYVVMPKALTAENGAKAGFTGEFTETHKMPNPEYCGCGKCAYCKQHPGITETTYVKVPVTWTTIKAIYQKAVTDLSVEF